MAAARPIVVIVDVPMWPLDPKFWGRWLLGFLTGSMAQRDGTSDTNESTRATQSNCACFRQVLHSTDYGPKA